MRKTFILSLISATLFCNVEAQSDIKPCGHAEAQEALYQETPGLKEESEARLSKLIASAQQKKHNQKSDLKVLPLVFHVIHQDGPENISFEQIESCVEWMNQEYNLQNEQADNIDPKFRDIAASVDIEFRLATIDPDGNCTNGVVRYYDERTDEAGEQIKSGRQWPNNQYINIYVVELIASGAAGYAYYPGTAPNSRDGIVIRHDYVGITGTGSKGRASALTHEIGHYLALPHTWGSTNNPSLADNCDSDDGIDDTPNTIGNSPSTGCNFDAQSCGSFDNVQNFMDYAYCYAMFTEGQKAVMRETLTQSTSGRNNLWTQENLAATGTLYPRGEMPGQLCLVDFKKVGDDVICPGESVAFENMSYSGDLTYTWTFEGGNPASSTEVNPSVIYSNPGTYKVTLNATDGNVEKSETKEAFITVVSDEAITYPFFDKMTNDEIGFNNFYLIDNWNDDNVTWEYSNSVGYDDNRSFTLDNRRNSGSDKIDELVSTIMNTTGQPEFYLSFRYAYAERSSSGNSDILRVAVTKDCGNIWSTRKNLLGNNLITAERTLSSFEPQSKEEWKSVRIRLNGFDSENFRFKIRWENGGGNNVFIDDINISNSALSVGELSQENIEVYPNPNTGSFKVENAMGTHYVIMDISGKVLQQGSIHNYIEKIDVNNIESGLYTLVLRNANSQTTKRITIQ